MSTMSFRLDDELHESLRKRAEREGSSVNSLLARAAEEYLVRHNENERVHQLGVQSTRQWADLLRRLA